MQLSDTLNKAIQENLPSMVGDELKKVLSKATDDAEALANLKDSFDRLTDDNAKAKARIAELEALGIKKGDLEKLEAELAEANRDLRVKLSEKDVLNSKELAAQALNMVGLIFRNSEVRKTMMTAVPVTQTNPGGYSTTSTHYMNESTSEEVK